MKRGNWTDHVSKAPARFRAGALLVIVGNERKVCIDIVDRVLYFSACHRSGRLNRTHPDEQDPRAVASVE